MSLSFKSCPERGANFVGLFRCGRKGVGVGKVYHYFSAVGVNLAIVIARIGVFAVARSVFGKKIQNVVAFSPDKVYVHASAFRSEAAVAAFQTGNARVAVFKTDIQLGAETAFYNSIALVRVYGEKLLDGYVLAVKRKRLAGSFRIGKACVGYSRFGVVGFNP